MTLSDVSTKERVILSWSSGKDCAWALHTLRQQPDVEVVGLLSTINADAERVAMHAVRRELLHVQARATGLPLTEVPIPYPCSNAQYEAAMGEAVAMLRERGVTAFAFGDLFLEDVRRYREERLEPAGMKALFPLFGADTAELAREMTAAGVRAIVTAVDPRALDRSFAGRVWDDALLDALPEGVNPCGENGELHTFVFAGPMLDHPIDVEVGENRGAGRIRVRRRAKGSARMRRALLVSALLFVSRPAAAQDVHRLYWSPRWARAHPASYAVTGVAIGATLFMEYLWRSPPEARIRGPVLFDAPAREALMASTAEGRRSAALASDILLGGMLAWPLVDSLAVAGIGDQNPDLAWQLTMMTAESYAANLLIGTLVKRLVGRERPLGARCTLEDRLEDPERCGPESRLRSFYSGHSSTAFNSAGLVCVEHLHLPLYGGGAGDYVACSSALLTAAIIATLRVVANRHYATDVLVGAVLGLATGLLLPYLLHFQWDPSDHHVPTVGATATGLVAAPMLSFGGSF